MSRATGVSNYLADLIVAMALLCVLVSGLFTALQGEVHHGAIGQGGRPMMEIIDILLSANFWAAALRIATPLDFRRDRCTDLRTCGRPQSGYRGDLHSRCHGRWMAVWLGAGLWGGRDGGCIRRRGLRAYPRDPDRTARPLPACLGHWRDAFCDIAELFHLPDSPAGRCPPLRGSTLSSRSTFRF